MMVSESSFDKCENHVAHTELERKAAAAMPSDDMLRNMAELYKLFADYSRVRLLSLLLHGELCVGDLAELMGVAQPLISNHLRLLRNSKLVKYRKEGRCVFYSLADSHVEGILQQALDHVSEGNEK